MTNLTQNHTPTFETVWAALEKTDRILSEQIAENARQWKELKEQIAENERLRKEQLAEKEEQRKKEEERQRKEDERFERERKKQTAELEKLFRETDRQIKANAKEIGGISHSNGEVAEAYFINSFKKSPYFAKQEFQFVDSNTQRHSKALELKDEYDLILCNGVAVVIIEIKYRAKKEDVEQTLKKAETFKILFPHYKDYALYLGLAGLHVYKNAEEEAKKQGVAIIKQVGNTMIINDEHLKAF